MSGWHEDLRRITQLRDRDQAVPRSLVYGFLEALMDGFPCPTDGHGGQWDAWAWHSGLTDLPADAARVLIFAGRLSPGSLDSVWITRDDVFRARPDWHLLFLASMAWGYGLAGYGLHRTRRILEDPGGDVVAEAIAELRKCAGPRATWRAFSRHGTAKVPGLATAFASKIAYFACYDRERGQGPLIADRWSAWGFWAVDGTWDIRTDGGRYAHYVETAASVAGNLGVRSDDIERALFVAGPHVRSVWRELRG